jgi:hypothetical protein
VWSGATRARIQPMRPRLLLLVILLALFACVPRISGMVSSAPQSAMDAPASSVMSGGGGNPMAGPCCTLQGAATSAVVLRLWIVVVSVVPLVLVAIVRATPSRGPRIAPEPSPGLHGRPGLHALLN